MGILDGVGMVLGLLGKGAGTLVNEVTKSTLGVGLVDELSGLKKDMDNQDEYIKYLEDNRDELIDQNGYEAYAEELDKSMKEREMIREMRMYGMYSKAENKMTKDREDLCKRKLKEFSDNQLKYVIENENAADFARQMAYKELMRRR